MNNFSKQTLLKLNDYLIYFIILVYLLIAALLISNYTHSLNPDGIAYINVAHRYLMGNFYDAINGTWSPLVSWLLLPFLYFRLDPVLSFRILNIFLSSMLIFFLFTIISKLSKDWLIRLFSIIPISIILLCYSLAGPLTPDVLSLISFFAFGFLLTKPGLFEKKRNLLLVAFVASFGFFARSFFLPFFLIIFFFFTLSKSYLDNKRWLFYIKRFLLTLFFFFIFSLPWIAVLSIKYSHPTYNTVSKYVFAMIGPKYTREPGLVMVQPFYSEGFMKPPCKDGTSINDDLSYIKVASWSPINSKKEFSHYLLVIEKNINIFYHYLLSFYLIPLGVALASFILLWLVRHNKYNESEGVFRYNFLLIINILGIVYSLGYLSLYLEPRYLWFIPISAVVSVLCLFKIVEYRYIKHWNAFFLRIVLIILFLLLTISPIKMLISSYKTNQESRYLETILKNVNLKNKRVASSGERIKSMFICYYQGCSYFGIPKPNAKDEIGLELTTYKIEYYLFWLDNSSHKPPKGYIPVIKLPEKGLYIYKKGL